jgi:hypothetical protein
MIYSNDNIKYFKGYLVFAGDGSEVDLPYIQYFADEFGEYKNEAGEYNIS